MVSGIAREERAKLRQITAREFLLFRQKFLMRQIDLAEALKVSRRTVQSVEAAIVLPGLRTRARFVELKRKYEAEAA